MLRFGSYVEVEREELREQVVVWGEAVGDEDSGVEVGMQGSQPALTGLSEGVVLTGQGHSGGEVLPRGPGVARRLSLQRSSH